MRQKLYVEPPEGASNVCPGHVALLSPDGGFLLGEHSKLGGECNSVAKVREAHNALLESLAEAGLLKLADPPEDGD